MTSSYPAELLAPLCPVMFVAGLEAPQGQPQDAFATLTARVRDALLGQSKPSVFQPRTKTFSVVLVDRQVQFPPRRLDANSAHSPLSPLTPTSPLHPDGLMAPIWIRKHTTLVPSVFVLFMRLYESHAEAPQSPLDVPDPEKERERDQEERKRDAELAAEISVRKRTTNERGIKLTVVLIASRKMLDDTSLDSRLTFIRRQSSLDSRAALFVLSPVTQSELSDFVSSLQSALYDPALEYYTNHSKRVRRKRNRHAQINAHGASSYPLNPLTPGGSTRPLRPEGWTVRYEYKMACFAEFRGENEVALKHYQDAYSTLLVMFGSPVVLPPRTKRWAEAKVLADCINIKIVSIYLSPSPAPSPAIPPQTTQTIVGPTSHDISLALAQHSSHTIRFGDFSRGWGIGEETFEWWSWVGRQHRVLAELVEQATKVGGLTIPTTHSTLPPSSSASLTSPGNALAAQTSGVNPTHSLQHPGYYYYMAARCMEMRRERFLAEKEAEERGDTHTTSPGFQNEKKVDHLVVILELYTKAYELFKKYATASSGSNENQGQSRLTLRIAHVISLTYYKSGKYDMAIRFFERIAKTYRREKWWGMLRELLETWFECCKHVQDVEGGLSVLVERVGVGAGLTPGNISNLDEAAEAGHFQDELLTELQSNTPSSDMPLLLDLSESKDMITSKVTFYTSETKVLDPAAFQIALTSPEGVDISRLNFSNVEIQVASTAPTKDGESDSWVISSVFIRHQDGDGASSSGPSVRKVELGTLKLSAGNTEPPPESETDLRWDVGDTIIFCGTIVSDTPTSVKIEQIKLTLVEGPWNIQIPLHPESTNAGSVQYHLQDSGARWLCGIDPPKFVKLGRDDCDNLLVRYRPHQVVLSVSQAVPAYLDEEYPLTIEISNADDRELEVVLDILLQPSDSDAVNTITLDSERSQSFIKGVSFGSLPPGVTAAKTLFLLSTRSPGDRWLDISVQSRCHHHTASTDVDESREPTSANPELQDVSEMLRTLAIPTVEPITTTFHVSYRRSLVKQPGLADLRTFDHEYWDDSVGGEAIVSAEFEFKGPFSVEVDSVVLHREDGEEAKILDSSSDLVVEGETDDEYLPGDRLSEACRISLSPSLTKDIRANPRIAGPGEYCVTWKRISSEGNRGPQCTSIFPLPSLLPPTLNTVTALLSVPPLLQLHRPTPLTLTIHNAHPTLSASIAITLEPVDPITGESSFVVSGLRSGRIPTLLPGGQEVLVWKVIPLECGHVKLPKIRVVNRRRMIASERGLGGEGAGVETEGEEVRVIDVRVEGKVESGDASDKTLGDGEIPQTAVTAASTGAAPALVPTHLEERDDSTTVLVLP